MDDDKRGRLLSGHAAGQRHRRPGQAWVPPLCHAERAAKKGGTRGDTEYQQHLFDCSTGIGGDGGWQGAASSLHGRVTHERRGVNRPTVCFEFDGEEGWVVGSFVCCTDLSVCTEYAGVPPASPRRSCWYLIRFPPSSPLLCLLNCI